MNDNRISIKFRSKINQIEIVEDAYQDNEFSHYYFYDSEKENGDFFDDINFYQLYIDKNDKILEIGTGTGRVLTRLFDCGYDIYGIEPSKEMINLIRPELQHRVHRIGIEKIKEFGYKEKAVNTIIIPATSVSLFEYSKFYSFLKEVKDTFKDLKVIYFDFFDIDFFEDTDGIIYRQEINDEILYATNFLVGREKVIYNILNSKKLAISEKNIYSKKIIEQIACSLGVKSNIVIKKNFYNMVEIRFKED